MCPESNPSPSVHSLAVSYVLKTNVLIISQHFFNYVVLRLYELLYLVISLLCRSQWPRGLRRMSSTARLLRFWVRISPGAWMFVCCECCVLSGRDICDGLITRTGEFYRMWRVVVSDIEISKTRRLKPVTGLWKYNH